MDDVLFTIGHSNHSAERLLELLSLHDIAAVVDVRSTPTSRYSPQANRDNLAAAFRGKLRYAWMGDLLGGRPSSPSYYDEAGHVLYGPLSQTPEFVRGLERIEENSRRYRIALLCSEGEPKECHRHLLIARTLKQRGFPPGLIWHILPDGSYRKESDIPAQAQLLEEAWRSPLSVLPTPPLSASSGALETPATRGSPMSG